MSARKFVAYLTSVLSLLLTCSSAHAADLDERVEQSLRWMPADAQALVVTNLGEKEIFTGTVLFPMTEPGLGWQLFFLRPLWALDEVLKSGSPDLCIDCVLNRSERNAEGGSQSCQFLYLKGDLSLYESQKQDLQSKAIFTYKKGERVIAEFGKAGKATYDVCMPGPGLLVGATTRKVLEQVLERMEPNKAREAFPASWPEWTSVNVRAPYWGFRRFAPGDPISPASTHSGVKIDPKAVSLAFSYDAGKQNTVVTYRSASADIKRIANALAGIDEQMKQSHSVAYSTPAKGALKIVVGNDPGHFPHVLLTSVGCWFGEMKIPDEYLQACIDRLHPKK